MSFLIRVYLFQCLGEEESTIFSLVRYLNIIWKQFPVLSFFAKHGLFVIWILMPTIQAFKVGK